MAAPHPDGAELDVRRGEPLRHGDDVGHHLPVIDRKPFAGAAESGHHLVADHQDAVPGAQLADAPHVAVGRHQDAVGAGHRLEDEGGDGLRPFELDHFIQHGERLVGGVPAARDPVIRIQHMDDARDARFGGPASRIAGEGDAAGRRAVIGAITREDFVTARRHPRQLDGVLVRFRAAVGEEEDVDVAGRDLGELGAKPRTGFGRHERVGVRQHGGLLGDRLNHPLVAVADVDAHQLAVEVDEPFSFRRPEVNPLGPLDRNRVDLRLRRPLEERVLLRERDHLVAGHRLLQRFGGHVILVCVHAIHYQPAGLH